MKMSGTLVALFFSYAVAEASILDIDPPDFVVRHADLVARVKIIAGRETACRMLEGNRSCIYVYRAEVLAAYSGKANSVLFYSGIDLSEPSHQELLIVATKLNTPCDTTDPLELSICNAEGRYAVDMFGYDTVNPIVWRENNGKQDRFVVVSEPFSWSRPMDKSVVLSFDGEIMAVPWEYMERLIRQWCTTVPISPPAASDGSRPRK